MAGKTKQRKQVLKGNHGNMMLVLTEDVPNLGKQGEVVEVRPGYGRNYLIPQGKATLPSQHNMRLVERHRQRVDAARQARIQDLKMLADQIQRLPRVEIPAAEGKKGYDLPAITIQANANDEGHLYGSVGAPDISKMLYGKNLRVEPDMVRLQGPIKECALYEVDLQLGYEIQTKIAVAVVPLKQAEKK
ncbi:MAG: 50S ribosomal protein L9 [Gemmataceae bacterium]|nr:50S ribosomal protein L9 [Gemmataceae bacterium]